LVRSLPPNFLLKWRGRKQNIQNSIWDGKRGGRNRAKFRDRKVKILACFFIDKGKKGLDGVQLERS